MSDRLAAGAHAGAYRKLKTMREVDLSRTKTFAGGLCMAGAVLLAFIGRAEAVECGEVVTGVEQLQDDLICTTDRR